MGRHGLWGLLRSAARARPSGQQVVGVAEQVLALEVDFADGGGSVIVEPGGVRLEAYVDATLDHRRDELDDSSSALSTIVA